MRVAVREPVVGRDALIAQAGPLELERLTRVTELQVRRAVEVGPDVRQILSEVPECERRSRFYGSGFAFRGRPAPTSRR